MRWDTPYLALTSELFDVYLWHFGADRPCDIGIVMYFLWKYKVISLFSLVSLQRLWLTIITSIPLRLNKMADIGVNQRHGELFIENFQMATYKTFLYPWWLGRPVAHFTNMDNLNPSMD